MREEKMAIEQFVADRAAWAKTAKPEMIRSEILSVASKELGVHEETPNWGKRVREYLAATGLKSPNPWCFAGDVEILTESGFVRFDELPRGLAVAQVDSQTRDVTFVEPIDYIQNDFVGDLVTFDTQTFGMTCDARHRFFGSWGALYNEPELRPVGDIGSQLGIPAVQNGVDDCPAWTDRDLELLAVFLADGSYHRGRISVQVSRGHKIEMLSGLAPYHVYEAARAYGRSKKPLTTFEFTIPATFTDLMPEYKEPSFALLSRLSVRQLRVFLECYTRLDGSAMSNRSRGKGNRSIYTSSAYLRDWLQMALTLAGYHSSWRMRRASELSDRSPFVISYSQKKMRIVRPKHLIRHYGAEKLFCVTVPSGLIVIRDPKGTVIVTGNCAAFVNWVLEQVFGKDSLLEKVPNQAYVQSYYTYAKAHGLLVKTVDVRPGDLFLLWFPSLGRYGHIGIVKTFDFRAGKYTTIEGNSNNTGSREGVMVCSNTRTIGSRVVFMRCFD